MSDILLQQNASPVKRFIPALALSVGVTFGLFWVMQELVDFGDELNLNEANSFKLVDFVQDIEEQEIRQVERTVEKPPEVETPPPEIDLPDVEIADPNALDLSIGPASTGVQAGITTANLGEFTDGDYLPLVRVQPQYPRRAQQRGIEGYVIVELTVNEDGTVPPDSIIVIEEDPKGYFGRAAKKAAEKFKYKPKVVNGTPQKVTGVTYKFTFELAE